MIIIIQVNRVIAGPFHCVRPRCIEYWRQIIEAIILRLVRDYRLAVRKNGFDFDFK